MPPERGFRGPKCLNEIKAPAQGGEAGDSARHLAYMIHVIAVSSRGGENFSEFFARIE